MTDSNGEMTFWDHLDELRRVLFRIVVAVVAVAVVAFLHKDLLFDIILAPHDSDFVTYQMLCRLGEALAMPSICPDDFHVELINVQLSSQFVAHLSASLYAGVVVASPYIIYQLFGFVSPALYERERRASRRTIVAAFILFFCGVLLSYYAVFPLSFRFLGTYQVSDMVANKITLSSYMSTFTTLSVAMGAVFEIPVVTFFLARMGILSPQQLRKYRRHAIVILLVIAAIITPPDLFSLFLLGLPMYLLYELSIVVAKKAVR